LIKRNQVKERKMKRTLIWMIAIVISIAMIATFTLSGCKGAEEEAVEETVEEAGEEEVIEEDTDPYPSTISGEVSFMTPGAGEAFAGAVQAVADMFMEEYPNIELTIVPTSADEGFTIVTTNLSSSKPWDTFLYWPGESSQPFVDQGLVAPLTEIYEKTGMDELAPGTREISRYRGHGDVPYAVITSTTIFALFYNVALFEEAGIEEVPETWDEFLAVCDKLMDAGIYPIGKNSGMAGLPHWSWMDKFMMRTNADDSYRQSLAIGEADFDTPEFRTADNYWDDLREYWWPDSTSAQYADAYAAFARGEYAIQAIGSWILAPYEIEMGLEPFVDYDVMLFPELDPSIPPMETFNGGSIHLSTAKKDNVAAQAWVAFWTRPDVQKFYNNHLGLIPAVASAGSDNPMLNKLAAAVDGRVLNYQWMMDFAVHSLVDNELEARSFGKITQDEEIANLNKVVADWKASLE